MGGALETEATRLGRMVYSKKYFTSAPLREWT